MTADDPALAGEVEGEVRALHAAIEAWFADRDGAWEPIAAALDPLFTIVSPDGRRLAGDDVLRWLHGARGLRPDDFRIRIEGVTLLAAGGALAAAAYDECQWLEGRWTRRHATALFRVDRPAARRLRWLRVHETWAAPAGDATD